MAAVAHVPPADLRRLVLVRTGPALRVPAVVPAVTYRRRRAVALVALATVVAALMLLVNGLPAPSGGGPLTASGRAAGGPPAAVYVVQPGDTFWEIARRLRPGDDPRPLVARMVAEHGSPVLVAGERLRLPAT